MEFSDWVERILLLELERRILLLDRLLELRLLEKREGDGIEDFFSGSFFSRRIQLLSGVSEKMIPCT